MKRYLTMLFLSSRLLALRFSSLTARKNSIIQLFAVSHRQRAVGSEPLQYHIRLAKKEDIPAISQCNIDNLPENYGYHYYASHLARWPELSYIVESNEKEMIGYVLGRVEMTPIDKGSNSLYQPPSYHGHVTSVAINSNFRGLGIAHNLMRLLHYKFVKNYNLNSVYLYCRVSNNSARRLYSEVLNYKVERIISEYYEDKEDACFMTLRDLSSFVVTDVEKLVQPISMVRK
jgi:ribosomal protein S18 acetylase RimI-like enzyme